MSSDVRVRRSKLAPSSRRVDSTDGGAIAGGRRSTAAGAARLERWRGVGRAVRGASGSSGRRAQATARPVRARVVGLGRGRLGRRGAGPLGHAVAPGTSPRPRAARPAAPTSTFPPEARPRRVRRPGSGSARRGPRQARPHPPARAPASSARARSACRPGSSRRRGARCRRGSAGTSPASRRPANGAPRPSATLSGWIRTTSPRSSARLTALERSGSTP